MSPKAIMQKYRKRVEKIMEEIRQACVSAGWKVGKVWFNDADDYSWVMLVSTSNKPDGAEPDEADIDVTFKICESEQYDGEKNGVNFALDIVTYGGRILGGLTPYNYSDECWVDRRDKDEVEARFRIMEEADADGVVDVIREYVDEFCAA